MSRRIVVAIGGVSAMLSLSIGMRQSFGLFMAPVTQAVGLSTAEYTLAVAVQNMAWGLTAPFIGWLCDRFGSLGVMVAGVLLYAAGLIVTIHATGVGTLLLGTGVLVGVALSCTGSSIAMSISARATPENRRSTVLGLVTGLGSLGTFVAAPMAQGLVASEGWKGALWGFTALALLMLPFAVMAGTVDRNTAVRSTGQPAMALLPLLVRASTHRGYMVTALAFFVCGLQLVFITTHLPNYLSICGQAPMLGAQAIAVLGGFNVVGSLLFGWLGGRYPKHVLLGGVYIARSMAVAAYFLLPPTPASTLLFASAMGFLWLGVVPLVNGLVAQMFGLRAMATLTGLAFLNHQVGSFLGAWGGGVIFDTLGSYDLAWSLGVLIGLAAGLAQMLMPSPDRRD